MLEILSSQETGFHTVHLTKKESSCSKSLQSKKLEKLVYALNNLDSLKEKCKKNPEIIWELSREKNIQSWIDMYEELLQRER